MHEYGWAARAAHKWLAELLKTPSLLLHRLGAASPVRASKPDIGEDTCIEVFYAHPILVPSMMAGLFLRGPFSAEEREGSSEGGQEGVFP